MSRAYCGMQFYIAEPDLLEQAKALGKRIEGRDGDYLIEAYAWRGNIYITDAGVRPLSKI